MKTQKAAVRSAQAEGAGLAQHFNKSLLKKTNTLFTTKQAVFCSVLLFLQLFAPLKLFSLSYPKEDVLVLWPQRNHLVSDAPALGTLLRGRWATSAPFIAQLRRSLGLFSEGAAQAAFGLLDLC